MRARHAERVSSAGTSFTRWRTMLGLTQRQAAEILGKSRRTVQDYEKTVEPVTPSFTDRIVMDMLAKGAPLPQPWPE